MKIPTGNNKLYWNQMVELKVAVEYIRRYRDAMGFRVTCLGTLRAIASSGSIAAWVIWKEYAFVWAVIIALSQLADALKDVFPFSKTHKAASDHAGALASLFLDARMEWETICTGRYTTEQIQNRWQKLAKLHLEAERRAFPHGLATQEPLFAAAQRDAQDYFEKQR